jgi:hypothetical protein
MPSDSGPELGLEQNCIEPGHWLIEGYDVQRVGRNGWNTYRFGPERVHWTRTLQQAREWIASQ